MTTDSARRHDLDALRATAMLLGIVLHAALSFTPFPWPVQDARQDESFFLVFAVLHGFRLSLFFILSGFFTAMLWRKRGLQSLLLHRFRRILVPCLLGLVTIVPAVNWVNGRAVKSAYARSAQARPVTDEGSGDEEEKQAAHVDIWTAARSGNVDAIKRVAATGANINARDPEFGVTPLCWAALLGQTRAVDALVESGADLEATNIDGATALHGAAFLGRVESAELLLKRGAEANARDGTGNSPMHNTAADWQATEYVAGLLRIEIDAEEVAAGRIKVAQVLERSGASTIGRPSGLPVKVARFTSTPLFSRLLFHHLWFLWHLCWLVLIFAGCVKIAEWLKLKRAPAWLIVSPVRFVWLIPLTMVPQYFMGVFNPHFGPDTSAGLVPMPQVLLYYAIFFGYGALYHDCDDADGRVGRWWWLTLPVGLLVVFPLGLEFSMGVLGFRDAIVGSAMHRPLAVALQVVYAWMVSFACMGLFRRLLRKENKTVRYVSDSAYWLYVAHVPLIIGAQLLVRDWHLPVLVKFGLVCVVVTGVLLLLYQTVVRYTVVGALLNGPRQRHRKVAVHAAD